MEGGWGGVGMLNKPPERRGEAWLDVWSRPIWDAHPVDLPH